LAWVLPEGMVFPFDFGFVPSTLGGEGDPLDVMVLTHAPVHSGCLIELQLIGIIEATLTERGQTERNDRLIWSHSAVPRTQGTQLYREGT
jgi:inorganic pyrophosphatase